MKIENRKSKYESALVVEFLVERFGYETLKAILADLAKGEQINAAISSPLSCFARS